MCKISVYLLLSVLCIFSVINGFSQITGKVEADKAKYKVNTVIYIEKADGNFKPSANNPRMDQKNLTFIPKILPVIVGSTVDFLNNDDVVHNVFSPDACAGKFNLGSWKKGEVKSHKYDKLGCQSVILCNVHPEMEAYVIVLQNPYYAVTDKEGNYSIKNVPPGKYKIKIWNEKLKASDQEIIVPASGKLEVNFQLKK